jgi:hypothetical protein|tara:strand:+ start:1325 stop:1939 length:615 start_codon:yes stop_codon:yes gene_type:complete
MKNYKLEEKIKDYIINPRDAIINFELACSYYDIQQYAAALSYYLRCGELSKDEDLIYESLILAWDCIDKAGDRKIFERGQILQLIAQSPHRPEGYHLICYWLEHSGEGTVNSLTEIYNQIYSYACIGISNIKNNVPFRYYKGYPGGYVLNYYKGFAGWHMGKTEESKDIFVNIYNNQKNILSEGWKNLILNNINNLGIQNRIKS